VVLLDDEVTLLVWSGSQATDVHLRAQALAVAEARACTRFPRPTLRQLQVSAWLALVILTHWH
jgi:hypothetical protein